MRARLSVRHLFVGLPVLAAAVAAVRPIRDNSFLWHVRAGAVQLDTGEVLRADPFSLTAAGRGWRTQSWLAELGYGLGERATGDLSWAGPLVAIVAAATLALVGLVVYRRLGRPVPTALVLGGLAWLALPYLVPRPVVFSYLLFALLLTALDRRGRWALPLLMWLWAAVHGSFVVGLGVAGLEAIRRRDRRLAATVGVSAVAASCTAHGLAVWGILADFARSRGALGLIAEWAPPDLTSPAAWPYVMALGAVLAGAAFGRIAPRDLIVVGPVLVFGLTSLRSMLPAAILLAPWAARAWPAAGEAVRTVRRPGPAVLNWGLAVVMVGGAALWGATRVEAAPDADRFPVTAAEALAAGPVFHDDRTGGYLVYAGREDVFIDDRAELYGTEFFERFVEVRSGRSDWQAWFAGYGVHQALLPVDTPLAASLRSAGWLTAYRDGRFEVLISPSRGYPA